MPHTHEPQSGQKRTHQQAFGGIGESGENQKVKIVEEEIEEEGEAMWDESWNPDRESAVSEDSAD